MKTYIFRRDGNSSVNVVILLVVALAVSAGAYLFLSGGESINYESEGNVIRFPNKPLARECAKIENLEFEIEGFRVTFNGQYTGTGGLIEFDTAFKLGIAGKVSSQNKALPFTEAEFVERLESEVNNKLADIVEAKAEAEKAKSEEGKAKEGESKKDEAKESQDEEGGEKKGETKKRERLNARSKIIEISLPPMKPSKKSDQSDEKNQKEPAKNDSKTTEKPAESDSSADTESDEKSEEESDDEDGK